MIETRVVSVEMVIGVVVVVVRIKVLVVVRYMWCQYRGRGQ